MHLNLLHLEDSSTDAELIGLLIRREWPGCTIRVVASEQDFQSALGAQNFDLILSDYTLPGFNGLKALALAQEKAPATPFMFLSGTIGEERAVDALKRGATDYILKDRPTRLIPAMRQAFALIEESSARREAEARLREQASLLDKARDAILATDLEHRVTYWNASAERLYGWSAAEVQGRRLDAIGLGFDPERFAAAQTQLFQSGEWRGEFRLKTRTGETRLVESTWSLVVGSEGQPRSILAIDTDVTERKKLETQLLRAQRMESIGTLAGGVAHDLNNVLTPILLSIDMLALSANAEDRDLIEKTRASASHGAALVQQLLAFARGGEAKRTRLDPRIALAELQALVRQSMPHSIQFVLRHGERLAPIHADATQFNQVLINLCINARDAMPAGGTIEIATTNVSVDAALAHANPGCDPGPYVRVSVADSGTGIPPEIMEKIFDPFFSTKPAGKGTGLGLSMVAGIMKSHGGFVQVESEIGRGATFHLYFPAMVEQAPLLFRDGGAGSVRGGGGETILLIDDEPMVRDTLKLLLQRAGYRVIAAPDGEAGIAEFERQRDAISLVISDMMLPGCSGMDVIKELRRQSPTLPAIAISGMMASGAFDDLLKLQPRVECLPKPLAPTVLFGVVRRMLTLAVANQANPSSARS